MGSLDNPSSLPTIRAQRVVEAQILDDDLQPRTITETLFLDQEDAVQALWPA
ncbi:hypothetical protein [Deinococcus irradiatisoli]|uniref:hypothetical protein n=1 Tax=Deinococcus irradiatisoli TaxID=2202254 RepID=UPI0015E83990|nr:hypothetical protein [Deinococcus irradiatisoli]